MPGTHSTWEVKVRGSRDQDQPGIKKVLREGGTMEVIGKRGGKWGERGGGREGGRESQYLSLIS